MRIGAGHGGRRQQGARKSSAAPTGRRPPAPPHLSAGADAPASRDPLRLDACHIQRGGEIAGESGLEQEDAGVQGGVAMVAQKCSDRGASAPPSATQRMSVIGRSLAGAPAVHSTARDRRLRNSASDGNAPQRQSPGGERDRSPTRLRSRPDRPRVEIGRELHFHSLSHAPAVALRRSSSDAVAASFRSPGASPENQANFRAGKRATTTSRSASGATRRIVATSARASCAELRDKKDTPILHAQPGRSAIVVSRRGPPEGSSTRASTVAILPSSSISYRLKPARTEGSG